MLPVRFGSGHVDPEVATTTVVGGEHVHRKPERGFGPKSRGASLVSLCYLFLGLVSGLRGESTIL